MQWKVVAGSLVGALVVAAACSSQHTDNPSAQTDSGSGGVVDAIEDVLGLDHAESDAKAAPDPKPTVTQVDCTSDAVGNWAAVLDLPGRSRDDIARSTALACKTAGEWPCYQAIALVKDGALRASCGTPSAHTDFVRFIVPPTP